VTATTTADDADTGDDGDDDGVGTLEMGIGMPVGSPDAPLLCARLSLMGRWRKAWTPRYVVVTAAAFYLLRVAPAAQIEQVRVAAAAAGDCLWYRRFTEDRLTVPLAQDKVNLRLYRSNPRSAESELAEAFVFVTKGRNYGEWLQTLFVTFICVLCVCSTGVRLATNDERAHLHTHARTNSHAISTSHLIYFSAKMRH
jgi:hypothetical protein